MKRFALLGRGIHDSLSPMLHKLLFAESGTAAEYSLIDTDDPVSILDTLRGLDGFNVTMPHKLTLLPYLSDSDALVKNTGSLNTVKVKNSGFYAYNTDYYGFFTSAEKIGSLSGSVLLIGTGGVSKTLMYGLSERGADVTVAKRSKGTGKIDFGSPQAKYGFIINATPVGTYPDTQKMPVPESLIKQAGAVLDLIYKPYETLLVKTAKKYGIPAKGGLEMLVLQAAEAQKIWLGTEFTGKQLKKVYNILQEYAKEKFG